MEARRLLLVAGCVLALLAVASTLPAADPRLDPPNAAGDGQTDDARSAGDWESVNDDSAGEIEETPTPISTPADSSTPGSESAESDETVELAVTDPVIPGTTVTIEARNLDTEATGTEEQITVTVNGGGYYVLAEDDPEAKVEIPYAEQITLAIVGTDYEKTVDVRTHASILASEKAYPGQTLTIEATIGAEPVSGATVFVNGTTVGETNDDGRANVSLPDESGTVRVAVERRPVTGSRNLTVAKPEISFATPLLFPGFPAPVTVTADGVPVANTTVRTAGNESALTSDQGRATVQLPIADTATVRTTVGSQRVSTTVGNLYLRLAVPVILLPGFGIGAVVTYVRVLPRYRRRRHHRQISQSFVTLGDLLVAGFGGVRAAGRRLIAGVRFPSVSEVKLSFPSISGGGLPSLKGLSLGFDGVGSLTGGLGEFLSRDTAGIPEQSGLGSDSTFAPDETDEDAPTPPELAPEQVGPTSPRAELRAAWYAFCARLGLDEQATLTPGQVARRAIAAGFPAEYVRDLLSLFRDAEYGDRDPTPEDLADARTTVRALSDYDPDEEGAE